MRKNTAPSGYVADVAVVGGGLAGVAAAVAAARSGAKTMLVEQHGCLGGMATMGLVNPFMPHYRAGCGEPGEEVVRGVFAEILDRLHRDVPLVHNAAWRGNTAFDSEALKWVLDELVLEAGAKVLFHAFLGGAGRGERGVTDIELVTKGGPRKVEAKVFVDATGDADLAHLCGCRTTIGREEDHRCQALTLMFRVSNVRTAATPDRHACREILKRAIAEARLRLFGKRTLLWFPYPGEGVVTFNQNEIAGRVALTAEDLTEAQFEGRRAIRELFHFLRREVPGFENCRVDAIAPAMGVRETRRLVGAHVLTAEELLGQTRFDDTIACGAYPVDIHDPDGKRDIPMRRLPDGAYYEIPYGSLTALEVDNLLVAGRCLSATHEAAAAVRIMPICTAMGQAAGTAAAMAASDDGRVRRVDVRDLRRRLAAARAFVGDRAD
jgi:glycine/D-amino acid oxidase-like deaminating enzyme